VSDTIEAGGKTIVTWLTPYIDTWEAHVGALAYGRLAKALTPARKLLGDDDCVAAFRAYCQSHETRKDPAWFAKDCKRWADKAQQHAEPLVSPTGTLTEYGRKVYEGMR